jgi:hypothetical protein
MATVAGNDQEGLGQVALSATDVEQTVGAPKYEAAAKQGDEDNSQQENSLRACEDGRALDGQLPVSAGFVPD